MNTWLEIKTVAETMPTPKVKQAHHNSVKRIRNLSSEDVNLISKLRNIQQALDAGEGDKFTDAVQLLYPVWNAQIDQTHLSFYSRNTFSDYFGITEQYNSLNDFFRRLSEFFFATINTDDATVDNWLTRIVSLINITGGHHFVSFNAYNTTFNMEELRTIIPHEKVYLPYAIQGLEAGFTAQEIIKISPTFYMKPYLNYTPQNLRTLLETRTYKDIRSLVTAYSSVKSIHKPSFDDFADVLNAGFTNATEFKTFIKNLRYNYSDPELFKKVVSTTQNLSAADAAVLKNKNATAAEISTVILKL